MSAVTGVETVVTYDAATGAITATYQASGARIAALTVPYLIVGAYRSDYDANYKVVSGALVALTAADKAPTVAAAAWAALRVQLDQLMAQYVDSVSAAQWASMTSAQQTNLIAYRTALLAVPGATTDPTSPVLPTPPS